MLNIKFMQTTTWMPRAPFAPRKGNADITRTPGMCGYFTKVLGALGSLNLIRLMAMGRLDDLRGLGVLLRPYLTSNKFLGQLFLILRYSPIFETLILFR